MAVLTTKGILCCEFTVRIDVDGSETVRGIEELCEDVFQEYKDVLISRMLDEDRRPVGELFDLTIGYDREIKFFIPRTALKRIERELRDSRNTEVDDEMVAEVQYSPRHSIS